VVVHSDDAFAPVAYLTVKKCRLEDKKDAALTILPHLNAPTSLPKNSKEENKHPKSLLSLLSNDNSSNFSQRNGFFYAGFQIATHPNQHSYAEELTIVMNNLKGAFHSFVHFVSFNVNTPLLIALLSKEGVSMNEVFFVYLYINDMQYFTQLNSVYKNYFNINPPSRYPPQHSSILTFIPQSMCRAVNAEQAHDRVHRIFCCSQQRT
jgi:diphthine-ammonia ligase